MLVFASFCAVYDAAYLVHCLKTGQKTAAIGAFALIFLSLAAACFFIK